MELFDSIERMGLKEPEKVFLATREISMTYRETLTQAAALAERIVERGVLVRPCLIKANDVAACIGVLACMSIGKPFIVVNPKSPQDRLAYYAQDSGANILVCDPGFSTEDRRPIGERLVVSDLGCPIEAWKTVVDAESVACLIYTSGSTGKPKAVVCPGEAMSFVAKAIVDALGYASVDVVLTALPMFFDFGLYQLFLAGRVGATVYFASDLESSLGLGVALERTGATILPMVPPAAEKLARLAKRGLVSNSVRMVTTTGAAMDEGTRLALQEAWGAVDVRVMYGLTECKRVAIMPAFESYHRTNASGIPLKGTTVTIRPHDSDTILEAEEAGEICVEGPHVMGGYHNQPKLTSQRYRSTRTGVVLRTGDTGFIDEDGYLHCLGRNDAQFKVSGYRVSSSEVIAAAKTTGKVDSAVVIPPRDGHEYALFFEGEAREDLVAQVIGSQLEPYAVPKFIRRLKSLPTNANGKIDMKQLEKEISNG